MEKSPWQFIFQRSVCSLNFSPWRVTLGLAGMVIILLQCVGQPHLSAVASAVPVDLSWPHTKMHAHNRPPDCTHHTTAADLFRHGRWFVMQQCHLISHTEENTPGRYIVLYSPALNTGMFLNCLNDLPLSPLDHFSWSKKTHARFHLSSLDYCSEAQVWYCTVKYLYFVLHMKCANSRVSKGIFFFFNGP